MATLLFFDDHALHRRDNLTRRLGRPALIPESVYVDGEANPAWGYPCVFRDEASEKWRMTYQGFLPEKGSYPLLAESEDGLRWAPRNAVARRGPAGNLLPKPRDLTRKRVGA